MAGGPPPGSPAGPHRSTNLPWSPRGRFLPRGPPVSTDARVPHIRGGYAPRILRLKQSHWQPTRLKTPVKKPYVPVPPSSRGRHWSPQHPGRQVRPRLLRSHPNTETRAPSPMAHLSWIGCVFLSWGHKYGAGELRRRARAGEIRHSRPISQVKRRRLKDIKEVAGSRAPAGMRPHRLAPVQLPTMRTPHTPPNRLN